MYSLLELCFLGSPSRRKKRHINIIIRGEIIRRVRLLSVCSLFTLFLSLCFFFAFSLLSLLYLCFLSALFVVLCLFVCLFSYAQGTSRYGADQNDHHYHVTKAYHVIRSIRITIIIIIMCPRYIITIIRGEIIRRVRPTLSLSALFLLSVSLLFLCSIYALSLVPPFRTMSLNVKYTFFSNFPLCTLSAFSLLSPLHLHSHCFLSILSL